MNEQKPTRCIDPVMKYCQECRYGWVKYPDWVETYEDTLGCCFESGCMYGLENDEPTEEELKEFEEWCRGVRNETSV
jgi:hypothetical protein